MMVSSHQNCMRNRGPRAQGGGTGGLAGAGQRLSVLSSAPVTQGAFSSDAGTEYMETPYALLSTGVLF